MELIFEDVGAEDEDHTYDWSFLTPDDVIYKSPGACDFEYIGDEDPCSGEPRWLCALHEEPDAPEYHEYFCWHHAAGILMDLEGVMQ